MRRSIVLLAVAIAGFAAIRGAAGEDNAQHAQRPYVAITGPDSHVRERGYFRVESEKEWIKVWQRHKGEKESEGYNFFYNPLGLPTVDFGNCMVIAIFEGTSENSAGYTANAVFEKGGRLILRFADKGYQTAGPNGGGQIANVYGFFVLPRSNKPVVLEEDVRTLIAGPPVWKEVAVLPPKGAPAGPGICLGMAFSDATAFLKAAGAKEIIPAPRHVFPHSEREDAHWYELGQVHTTWDRTLRLCVELVSKNARKVDKVFVCVDSPDNGPVPIWDEDKLPHTNAMSIWPSFYEHEFKPVQPGDEFKPLTLDELKPWRERIQAFAAPASSQAKKK